MIETMLVAGRGDLEDIVALQRANHRDHVPADVARAQGFVTAAHTVAMLEAMHALAPSVIARAGAELAGYALVMPVEARAIVPILDPMFRVLETLTWRGRPLAEQAYYVMGQICVAEAYRGQGVVPAMYREHRAQYAGRYRACVTEIATRNTRSMRAHERVGFETIHVYADATDEWAVVAWDLA